MSLLVTGTRQVLVEGGAIVALDGEAERLAADADRFDATGLRVSPALIDIQVNGGCGRDFTRDPSAIWEVGSALPRHGVSAFLPTIVSGRPAEIDAAQAAIAARPADYRGAEPLGLHLEGPFLAPAHRGAHEAGRLREPDRALAGGWSPRSGVRMVTLAPELADALEVIELLVGQGVVIGLGHSAATAPQAAAALDAGARYGTHLFNAMPPLHHRDPGLAGQLLADRRATSGLIADGIHVDPVILSLAWRLLGPGRWSTVTDAVAVGEGSFTLAGVEAELADGAPRTADGRLAGSTLSLDRAVRNLVSFTDATTDQALETVTTTPASLLGLTDRGRLEPGMRADLALLDDDLGVAATFIGGRSVYVREGETWR